MKAAPLSELKKDLGALSSKEILELCLRLARFKKENKELLSYLLYESMNEENYVSSIKEQMDIQFGEINYTNMHFAKKSFRKILRTVNKFIRYSDNKSTEIELLLHYCKKLKASKLPIHKSQQMMNLYQRQVDKIKKGVSCLHEDLQYDYEKEIGNIEI